MYSKKNVLKKALMILGIVFFVSGISILSVIMQMKTVTLDYFGNDIKVRTMATTVEEFLTENKIYISDEMRVLPTKESNIEDNMNLSISSKIELASISLSEMTSKVSTVIAKVVEETTEIPYETEEIESIVLSRGNRKVVTEGSNGSRTTTYLVKYNDEDLVYKAEISSVITAEAVNEVIEVGTAIANVVNRGNLPVTVDDNFVQYNINLSTELQKYTYNLCKNYGVQYQLMLALMYVESGYNVGATSYAGAQGICQIMPANLKKLSSVLGISNLYDAYDNIAAGVYMLSNYENSAKKFGTDADFIEKYALNSYNMGEGGFFNTCYSKGVLDRYYSTRIRSIRDRIVLNGEI